jgi:LPS-assembly protein
VTSQWADFDAQRGRFNAGQTAVSLLEGSRTHVEPSLSFRRDGGSGYWALRGGYKFTEYNLDRSPSNLTRYDDQQTDRGIGFFSADAGLFFERDIRLGGERLVHTLEPRIYYLNQGYEAQDSLPVFDSMPLSMTFGQLFSDNRFAGLDRIGDADRLTLAATSRVLSASGRELGSFALAYMDHLSKPRVEWPGPADIGASDLVASEQTLNAKNGWQLRTRQLWNNERSAWEELGASLHLRGSGRRIYNVGVNRRLLDEIEQAEFSAYAPLNHHVAVTSRWHYDIEGHRTLEAFVGLEYDDCCVRFRLLARQYLENPSYRNYGLPQSLIPLDDLRTDRGVLLEVQLKGLAGFGSKVDALLRRSVYGYGSPAGLVR